MEKSEREQYAKLVASMSVDFLLGKMTWDHYLTMLKAIIEKTDDNIRAEAERIRALEHYRDTSLGLYCIDQKPEDVSYEWICKNAFQLTDTKKP